jgi:superfamily II DNA/RNA helicase
VHRIGRTARANHDGCAITFVSEKEQTQFKTIEDFLERNIYKIPVPDELGEAPEYAPKRSEGKNRRKYSGKGKGKGNANGQQGRKTNSRKKAPSQPKD